ncbi:hypothetical protein STEG23_011152, partial [Scotinomys teguina]
MFCGLPGQQPREEVIIDQNAENKRLNKSHKHDISYQVLSLNMTTIYHTHRTHDSCGYLHKIKLDKNSVIDVARDVQALSLVDLLVLDLSSIFMLTTSSKIKSVVCHPSVWDVMTHGQGASSLLGYTPVGKQGHVQ